MARSINLTLRGKDKFSPAAKKASSATDKLTSSIARSVAGWAAAAVSIRAVASAMRESVRLAREQETAERALDAAIATTGRTADISASAIRSLASELQQVTTYGDEATIQAAALAQTLGDLNQHQLEQAIPAIQDFATALGMDLQQAAQLVGKTIGGTTNSLSRYGVEIDNSLTGSERADAVISELTESFDGLSEAMADTASGSLEQFGNALGDLKEIGGQAILDFIEPAVRNFTRFIGKLNESIQKNRDLQAALRDTATMQSIASLENAIEMQRGRILDLIEQARRAGGGQLAMSDLDEITGYTDMKSNLQRMIERQNQLKASLSGESTGDTGTGGGTAGTTGGDEPTLAAQILALRDDARQQIEIAREQAILLEGSKLSQDEIQRIWGSAAEDMIRLLVESNQHVADWAGPGTALYQAIENMRGDMQPLDRLYTLDEVIQSTSGASYQHAGAGGTMPGARDAEPYANASYQHAGAGGSMSTFFSRLVADVKQAFGGLMSTFGPLIGALGQVSAVLNPIGTIISGIMSVLGPAINDILEPISGILYILGQLLGAVLTPVLQALTPVIEFVGKVFVWLYNKILLKIANGMIRMWNRVYNGVVQIINWVIDAINKIPRVSVSRVASRNVDSGTLAAIDLDDLSQAGQAATEGSRYRIPTTDTASTSDTAITGGRTTVQRVPDIYVYQTYEAPIIGESGMRAVGEFMVGAIQEYVGAGGNVQWVEGTA